MDAVDCICGRDGSGKAIFLINALTDLWNIVKHSVFIFPVTLQQSLEITEPTMLQ